MNKKYIRKLFVVPTVTALFGLLIGYFVFSDKVNDSSHINHETSQQTWRPLRGHTFWTHTRINNT